MKQLYEKWLVNISCNVLIDVESGPSSYAESSAEG
jgi:hypothetical protein